ncbi:hypothetical protein EXU57_16055 [Segetibacter sp. 3557_3]|uniref:OB-fold protein n=1 Tax=Segetibacter sp. 3557_3 TaxID=2547429 RepID=UPI001058D12C|nr:hypothetical protein [Segetibacter sp. 3557_3]TDH24002.1 hypothetical protein EXU57_16055 [Segetibacter sp. 3557_3]
MRKKNLGTILLVILILAVAGAVIGYRMWNKPNRSVANEAGIAITAADLVTAYQADENAANAKFLDKAIEVSGTISAVDKSQDGKSTIMLSSDDPMTGVYCTLKIGADNLAVGTPVKVKGFCSGMLSDVRLRDAVIVK